MKTNNWVTKLVLSLAATLLTVPAFADEYLNGIDWKEPALVVPGEPGAPPSDAVVLFNGKDFSAWKGAENWKIENGAMVCGKGDLRIVQACKKRLPAAHRMVCTNSRHGKWPGTGKQRDLLHG